MSKLTASVHFWVNYPFKKTKALFKTVTDVWLQARLMRMAESRFMQKSVRLCWPSRSAAAADSCAV